MIGVGDELDIVEDEELGLGAEVGGIGDARRLHVGFGLPGDAAGVALVGLAGGRLRDVAENGQGGLGEERVDVGAVGVDHEEHVGGFDAFPAGDRGAVEGVTVGEHLFIDTSCIRRHVLHLSARVGKAEVDELDVLVLDSLYDVCRCGH